MAQSRDITQKITLTGSEEVKRQLEQIGASGERAFAGISRGAAGTDPYLQRMGGSSRQVGFALRNLSFQANDLFTSLASGAPIMQVFAQQGGQIVQAFQQGGGLGTVLGGVASSVKAAITPMRALAGVGAGAAAGVAVLGARAISADNAVRQFGVTLDALRPPAFLRGGDAFKGFGITPEQLEKTAQELRAVGLSASEARQEINEAMRAGIPPALTQEVIKFGKDLDAAFGEKGNRGFDAFKKAIAGGVPELRKFGQDIGVINPRISELQDGLRDIPSLLKAITNAPNIKGAAVNVLDPISKSARDINVEFNNILNNITLFGKEGFVNLVGTGAAAVKVFGALAETIARGDIAGLARGLAAALDPFKNLGKTLFTSIEDGAKAAFAALPGIAATAFDEIRNRLSGADPFGIAASLALLPAKAQAAYDAIKAIFLGQPAAEGAAPGEGQKTVFDPFGITAYFASLPAKFQAGFDQFNAIAVATEARAREIWAPFGDWLKQTLTAAGDVVWKGFETAAAAAIKAVQDRINALAQAVRDIISSLGSIGSEVVPGIVPPAFAHGGAVRGRGTGTSDSIWARVSAGEYIATARAVRFWGPDLFAALNNLQMPRFAIGGLVDAMNTPIVPRQPKLRFRETFDPAGRGGLGVHLHLDSQMFSLRAASGDEFDRLVKAARRSQLLSAGRKPSYTGGRRYGG